MDMLTLYTVYSDFISQQVEQQLLNHSLSVSLVKQFEFLKHFGLSSIKDLPKVDELESIIL